MTLLTALAISAIVFVLVAAVVSAVSPRGYVDQSVDGNGRDIEGQRYKGK